MKKLKLLAALVAVTAFSAPAFSIAQIGVQGNYNGLSMEQSNITNKYSGLGFGAFARFTVGLPLLVTFGFGPYVDYASLSNGPKGAADAKNLRAGGELVVYADVVGNLIGLTPYARFGYGYEGNTLKVTNTITNTVVEGVYYGSSTHTIFGLTMKVIPLVYLFAEGGATWSKQSAPDSLKSLGYADINTSGWRASVGVMIWL